MLRAANSVANMSAEGFSFDMVAFKEEINGTTAKDIFFSKNESFCRTNSSGQFELLDRIVSTGVRWSSV